MEPRKASSLVRTICFEFVLLEDSTCSSMMEYIVFELYFHEFRHRIWSLFMEGGAFRSKYLYFVLILKMFILKIFILNCSTCTVLYSRTPTFLDYLYSMYSTQHVYFLNIKNLE
mmetsp:Transcript_17584/g.39766  ORF Transcript_17584/g.39766 Transcript_17584/m.39766 type:complete len:114 (-) Transcript_17584:2010-2351(-)